MIRYFIVKMAFILVGLILLTGCNNKEKRREIEAYVAKIESRKIKGIEPLPDIKLYEPLIYTAYNIRSPFVPSFSEEMAKKVVMDPDFNRRKEALEAFPLDSLRMVGTLEKDHTKWALVSDPKGAVYRLSKGNYVGQNHGKINTVCDDKLLITEIIPDLNGGWREQKVFLALAKDKAI